VNPKLKNKKRPGKTLARREANIPKTELGKVTYLFVLGISGAAGGAFVLGAGVVSEDGLQPVTTVPTTIANNTIRVYNLFIVGLNIAKTAKRTSRIFDNF
jgi:hypothetical protein